MKIIALSNQKGGCGKTSTAHALGAGLAKRGNKTLFIDMDAQCNLCDYCGIDTEQASNTIYHVFKQEIKASEAVKSVKENLDIMLGDLALSEADREFTRTGSDFILREALTEITNDYDFCVIDTEPHLGVLLSNALTAADSVIIPLTPSRFSIKGMKQLKRYIDGVRKYTNPELKIEGVLLTRYVERVVLNRILFDDVKRVTEELETKLFRSTIRQSITMDESQVMQEDIFQQDSNIAKDYNNFIDEVLEGMV